MDLFQRLIYGGSNVSAKPLTGLIKNELLVTTTFISYLGSTQTTFISYPCFVSLKDLQVFDGANVAVKEFWVNGQFHSSSTNTQDYEYIHLYPGINTIKVRIKDTNGLWSDFSNEIIYDIRNPLGNNNTQFIDNDSSGSLFDGFARLPSDWADIHGLGIGIKFTNNPDQGVQGSTGILRATIFENRAETIILELAAKDGVVYNPATATPATTVGRVITPPPNNINNHWMLWTNTGIIGIKAQLINCVPGTTAQVTISGNAGYPSRVLLDSLDLTV